MRCGLVLVISSGLTADAVVALARAGEAAGADQLVVATGRPGVGDPLVLLGALARQTSRAALVCGSSLEPAARSVGILGKELTTVDRLSNGRAGVILASQASAWEVVSGARPGGGTRQSQGSVEGVGEALAALHRLWRKAPVSFEGRSVVLRGARNLPPPRRPGKPVVLAGLVPPGGGGRAPWRVVAPGRLGAGSVRKGPRSGSAGDQDERGSWWVLAAADLLRAGPGELRGRLLRLHGQARAARAAGAEGVLLALGAARRAPQADWALWSSRVASGLGAVQVGGPAR